MVHTKTCRSGNAPKGARKRKPKPEATGGEPRRPGDNDLYLVAFRGGSKGFMARNEDSAALAFFDAGGERLYGDPGWNMVVRCLGSYAPGDEDGFWALVTRA